MRTTLTIDPDLAVQLERLRRDQGLSLKEVVNRALRIGLQRIGPSRPNRRFETRVADTGRCLLPDVDRVADLLADDMRPATKR